MRCALPSHDPSRRRLQAQVAAATRHQSTELDNLRRELAEDKLTAYIKQVVDAAPPLTPEQRGRLAQLLVVRNAGPVAA